MANFAKKLIIQHKVKRRKQISTFLHNLRDSIDISKLVKTSRTFLKFKKTYKYQSISGVTQTSA
jgi:RNA binding exosome subunit